MRRLEQPLTLGRGLSLATRLRLLFRHWFSAGGPKLFRDFFALAGGQLFSMTVGFLSFVYLARVLDPTTYGAVEYAIGLTAGFAMFIDGGLSPIGVRRLSLDRSAASGLAAEIPTARLIVALFIVPLVGVGSYLVLDDTGIAPLVWLCAFAMMAIPWKQDWLFQGLEKMHHVALANATRMTAFFVVLLLLVRDSEDLVLVGLAELVAAATVTLYYLGAQSAWAVPLRFTLPSRRSWQLLREGVALALSNLIWAFMQYGPLFLVTYLVGSTETAWFGSSQRVVTSMLTFSFVYYFNLYPVIARRLAESKDAWMKLIGTSSRVGAWMSVGVALCFTLLADPVMTFIFGVEFRSGVFAFSCLVWVLPVRFLSGHARYSLIGSGLQRYLFLSDACGAVAVVVLGFVLIPSMGAGGAAIATLTGNVVAWVAAHLWTLRHVGQLPPVHVFLLPFLAAVVCGAGWRSVVSDPLYSTLLGMASYGLAVRVAGGDLIADVKSLAYAKAEIER